MYSVFLIKQVTKNLTVEEKSSFSISQINHSNNLKADLTWQKCFLFIMLKKKKVKVLVAFIQQYSIISEGKLQANSSK